MHYRVRMQLFKNILSRKDSIKITITIIITITTLDLLNYTCVTVYKYFKRRDARGGRLSVIEI